MADVTIYTTFWCPYCHRAKALLKKKGVDFNEIDVTTNADKRSEMEERSGRRTVPQIFIDGEHIGGSDDLAAMERAGELDAKLAQASPA